MTAYSGEQADIQTRREFRAQYSEMIDAKARAFIVDFRGSDYLGFDIDMTDYSIALQVRFRVPIHSRGTLFTIQFAFERNLLTDWAFEAYLSGALKMTFDEQRYHADNAHSLIPGFDERYMKGETDVSKESEG